MSSRFAMHHFIQNKKGLCFQCQCLQSFLQIISAPFLLKPYEMGQAGQIRVANQRGGSIRLPTTVAPHHITYHTTARRFALDVICDT